MKKSFYEIWGEDHIGNPKEMIFKFNSIQCNEYFKKIVLDNLERDGYTKVEIIRVDEE